ncbi:MAG: hypothetical protein LBU86_00840 [Oscillospiraceae bacterium]|jgi:hypothetical protein|nr:hypothetical protein [Oscillospiraceae bacterium]
MLRLNRFTRRELKPQEVFAFSLILCDNEIDRDGECFTEESLKILSALFVGKTGVFDHNPKAEHQSARIFETSLERPGGENALGEPLCRLRAWAYMLRSEKNADLIAEIDGGIKKEVSVSCAVERAVCSVCGADQKAEPCAHRKGEEYNGKICCHLLVKPTDAYEWSFVAVPAQKSAGVTKRAFGRGEGGPQSLVSLEKLFEREGDVLLQKGELRLLEGQYKALAAEAEAGRGYLGELRREVTKLAALSGLGFSPGLVEKISGALLPAELAELRKTLVAHAAKAFPIGPQLAPAGGAGEAETAYSI